MIQWIRPVQQYCEMSCIKNYLSRCGRSTVQGKNDGDGGGRPGHPGLLDKLPQLSRRVRCLLVITEGDPVTHAFESAIM